MYNVTLITGHKAWTTTEKPTTVGGILEFTDGAGNRISVPQSAVWVEQPSRGNVTFAPFPGRPDRNNMVAWKNGHHELPGRRHSL
jgi:hypothetical protein